MRFFFFAIKIAFRGASDERILEKREIILPVVLSVEFVCLELLGVGILSTSKVRNVKIDCKVDLSSNATELCDDLNKCVVFKHPTRISPVIS